MRFFEEQRKAKEASFWLALFFALTIIFLSGIFGFGLSFFVSANHSQSETALDFAVQQQRFFMLGLKWSGAVALFICAVSAFRSQGLDDGHTVAERMGGTLLQGGTSDPLERRLQNVVEEMSIASGVSMPAIYILKIDSTINSFAAGELKNHQVIGITQGALENLTRDELQAVIGHEFSHILHGDMSLNMSLAGYVSGIVIFFEVGKLLLNLRGRPLNNRFSSRADGGLWGLGLFLYIIGAGGVCMARLLQRLVSQQREILADASSVQFTRNPQALAKALARIKWMTGSKLLSPATLQFSNLFFADADELGFLGELFSSHPPIEERIRRLDPNFDREAFLIEGIHRARDRAEQALASPIETPSPRLALAQTTLAEIPENIKIAAADSVGARAVMVGAILSRQSAAIQEKVLALIEDPRQQKSARESLAVAQMKSSSCLALMQLSLASLKLIPVEERRKLRELLRKIFKIDGKIEFFEILQMAVIEILLEIRPQNMTEIINAKVVNSQIRQVLHLIRLREPGKIEDMDSITEDLRVLRRLAPKLKQEFIASLCQGFEFHEKQTPWHEDCLRLICWCLAVPSPFL